MSKRIKQEQYRQSEQNGNAGTPKRIKKLNSSKDIEKEQKRARRRQRKKSIEKSTCSEWKRYKNPERIFFRIKHRYVSSQLILFLFRIGFLLALFILYLVHIPFEFVQGFWCFFSLLILLLMLMMLRVWVVLLLSLSLFYTLMFCKKCAVFFFNSLTLVSANSEQKHQFTLKRKLIAVDCWDIESDNLG